MKTTYFSFVLILPEGEVATTIPEDLQITVHQLQEQFRWKTNLFQLQIKPKRN